MQCKAGIRSQLQIRTSCQSKTVSNKQPTIHVLWRRVGNIERQAGATPLSVVLSTRHDLSSTATAVESA